MRRDCPARGLRQRGPGRYAIAGLVAQHAPIDAGVGSQMGVSAAAPVLDSAYKLVTYAGGR